MAFGDAVPTAFQETEQQRQRRLVAELSKYDDEKFRVKLRDEFAKAALTGLLAHRAYTAAEAYAREAYMVADAMLAERARREEG